MSYLEKRKLSQSVLARMDVCPESARLYIKHRDERVQSHAMARGEAFHAFVEEAIAEMRSTGEVTMDPDVGRELMDHVLEQRPDLPVPVYERDALRGMAWHWAAATEGKPIRWDQLAAVEVMVELELAGWTVRGRIDRVEVRDHDAYIRDYKTSLAMPSQEQFEQSFQTPFYALLWAEGTVDGERVGEGIDTFHIANEYPRFLSKRCQDCGSWCDAAKNCDCGSALYDPPDLGRRWTILGKRELHDFRRGLEAILAKFDEAPAESIATGAGETFKGRSWPASPGSHCSTCAAPGECPITATLRPTVVESDEHATALAEELDRIEARAGKIKKALKSHVEEGGEARYGDQEWSLTPVISNKTDKEALAEAARAGGADPRDFIKPTTSLRFKKKKATA